MFRLGDTVVFNPDSFNPDYWNKESNVNKLKYYGCFYYTDICTNHEYIKGVGFVPVKLEDCKPKLLTFICEHRPQTGHCVLMDMHTGELLPMCHVNNFRLVSDEEC